MNRITTVSSIAIALVGVLFLSGCPQPVPPFDVSGIYEGAYTLDNPIEGASGTCDFELELYHETRIPLIRSTFAGLVRISWDCLLTPSLQDTLGLTGEYAVLPVLATLEQDGSYALEIDLESGPIPEALRNQFSDAEETPLDSFESFQFIFNGQGYDVDEDGFMDETEGGISVVLEWTDEDGAPDEIQSSGAFSAVYVEPAE
ncbi:MAG: hypothetical protein ACLFTT_11585 [Candidatus Hydrogenedentota bacterium]